MMPVNSSVIIKKYHVEYPGYYIPSFFRCNLERTEIICLLILLCSSTLLQLNAILASGVADILLTCTAAISWMTPVSGFAYIAASQILPFPPDSFFNPSQIGFFTWLIVIPFRYRRISLRNWQIMLAFLPCLLWFWAISGKNLFDWGGEYAKAMCFGIIGIQLANEAKGRYLKCLMGLCLGCITVSFGYWASLAGLPVTLSNYGGLRGDYLRLGGVRTDSVMVWPPLLMGCFGFLGIVLSSSFFFGRKKTISKTFYLAAIVIVFLAVPCLIATMTHGAVIGFILMNVFLFSTYFNPRINKHISLNNKRIIQGLFALLLSIIFLLFIFNIFGVLDRAIAIFNFFIFQSNRLGSAASRTDVWEQAIRLTLSYPFLGVLGNDALYMVRAIGGAIDPAQFLAHNVFLDFGWQVGLPGMFLLVFAFLLPFIWLMRSKIWLPYAGFLCFYFASFIFWMTLSYQYYKTFWAFWALFCLAVMRTSPRRIKAARIFDKQKPLHSALKVPGDSFPQP